MKTLYFNTMLLSLGLFAQANQADGASLLYGLDFNSITSGSGINMINTDNANGTTAISSVGGFKNYNQNDANGSGFSHTLNGGTFSINNSNGIGANSNRGFALSFDVLKPSSTSGWPDLFTLSFGSYMMKVEMTNAAGVRLYTNLGNTDPNSEKVLGDIVLNNWSHVALNVLGNSLTVYINGEKTSEFTLDTTNLGDITKVQGLGGFSNHTPPNTLLFDNLGIFEGNLSASEIDFVQKNAISNFVSSTPTSIPEPTTATLSLLALVGLMKRRRRFI